MDTTANFFANRIRPDRGTNMTDHFQERDHDSHEETGSQENLGPSPYEDHEEISIEGDIQPLSKKPIVPTIDTMTQTELGELMVDILQQWQPQLVEEIDIAIAKRTRTEIPDITESDLKALRQSLDSLQNVTREMTRTMAAFQEKLDSNNAQIKELQETISLAMAPPETPQQPIDPFDESDPGYNGTSAPASAKNSLATATIANSMIAKIMVIALILAGLVVGGSVLYRYVLMPTETPTQIRPSLAAPTSAPSSAANCHLINLKSPPIHITQETIVALAGQYQSNFNQIMAENPQLALPIDGPITITMPDCRR